jgi:hypothetical protein
VNSKIQLKLSEAIEGIFQEEKEEFAQITEKIEYMKVEDKNLMNLKLSNTYKPPVPKEEKPATPQEEGVISENEKESKKRPREDPKLAEQRKSKKTNLTQRIENLCFGKSSKCKICRLWRN